MVSGCPLRLRSPYIGRSVFPQASQPQHSLIPATVNKTRGIVRIQRTSDVNEITAHREHAACKNYRARDVTKDTTPRDWHDHPTEPNHCMAGVLKNSAFVTTRYSSPVRSPEVSTTPAAPGESRFYSYILEACGNIVDSRILNVGYGTGELARVLDVLGAKVSAIDTGRERLGLLRREVPGVAWWSVDNLATWKPESTAEAFDVIVACEGSQLLGAGDSLDSWLGSLDRGGRLVSFVDVATLSHLRRWSQNSGKAWNICYRSISVVHNAVASYQAGSWLPLRGSDLPNAARSLRVDPVTVAKACTQVVVQRHER